MLYPLTLLTDICSSIFGQLIHRYLNLKMHEIYAQHFYRIINSENVILSFFFSFFYLCYSDFENSVQILWYIVTVQMLHPNADLNTYSDAKYNKDNRIMITISFMENCFWLCKW